jgi:hypothetical protein
MRQVRERGAAQRLLLQQLRDSGVEAGIGRASTPVLGLWACIVLIIVGAVMFFTGMLLVLAGNYDHKRIGDWAGLFMMVFGLAVRVFSILLYRNIK